MKLEVVSQSDSHLIIAFSGEMDAQGCSEVKPDIEALVTEPKALHILVDMDCVNFLDSSGIGAIVYLYKRVKSNGGSLSIEGANGQPLELMELLRIGSAIPINKNPDDRLSFSGAS